MIGAQLQRAIYAALMESPAVAGGRVYDRVPPSPVFPYVTIGDEQLLDDGNSCEDGWEVSSDIHVWSRPVDGSKAEVKDLAASIPPRIARASLVVSGFRTVVAELTTTRVFRDPDGITEHAVLTFRHVLAPN